MTINLFINCLIWLYGYGEMYLFNLDKYILENRPRKKAVLKVLKNLD